MQRALVLVTPDAALDGNFCTNYQARTWSVVPIIVSCEIQTHENLHLHMLICCVVCGVVAYIPSSWTGAPDDGAGVNGRATSFTTGLLS